MYLPCVHVLVLQVLVALLLVGLLTLNIYVVLVKILDLTRQGLQRCAGLILNDGLGEPEGLRLAALTAHGQLEVRHTLLRPLELYDRVHQVDASVKFYELPVVTLIFDIVLIVLVVLVAYGLYLI